MSQNTKSEPLVVVVLGCVWVHSRTNSQSALSLWDFPNSQSALCPTRSSLRHKTQDPRFDPQRSSLASQNHFRAKFSKSWSKTRSPMLLAPMAKHTLGGSFSKPCFKLPIGTWLCPAPYFSSTKSDYFPNGRTDERTNEHVEFCAHQRTKRFAQK